MYGHALSWWAVIGLVGSIGLFVLFGLGYIVGADRSLKARPRHHRADREIDQPW